MLEQSSAPELVHDELRTAPSEEFIAAIRRRFPVEGEIDRIMTRKMQGRTRPAYSAIPLARLAQGARAAVAASEPAIELARAWCVPAGFAADPAQLRSLDHLLD